MAPPLSNPPHAGTPTHVPHCRARRSGRGCRRPLIIPGQHRARTLPRTPPATASLAPIARRRDAQVQPGGERSAAFVRGVNGEFKAVLVVRGELGMSAGKVGAQCAHAAVGLYKRCLATGVPWLLAWEAQGEKTVVLRAQSEREMETLERQAERLGLPSARAPLPRAHPPLPLLPSRRRRRIRNQRTRCTMRGARRWPPAAQPCWASEGRPTWWIR